MSPYADPRRAPAQQDWWLEIVSADAKTVSKKGPFPSQSGASAWIAANAGKDEYKGAMFHITRSEPQYRGPRPPSGPKPSTVTH